MGVRRVRAAGPTAPAPLEPAPLVPAPLVPAPLVPVLLVPVLLVIVLLAAALTACGSGDPGGSTARPAAGAPGESASAGHSAPHSAEPKIPLRAGERFQFLAAAQPYTPKAPSGGTDEYRCFLIDPHLTDRTFVVGSEFLPDNADIVHHAILFRVEPGDVADAKKLDAQTPDDGWTCFSDAGIRRNGLGSTGWIGSWAPGGTERLIDAKVGFELAAGSQIIMQVHYNLLATDGKAPGADRSGVRLRLMDGSANLTPLQTALLPAPVELPCPPNESGDLCDRERAVADVSARFGAQAGTLAKGLSLVCNRGAPKPGNTQRCDHRVRQDAVVHGVAGHMHLLGRSIKVELNPGTPKGRVLLDVPVYNFDDQGARPPPAATTAKAGDTYRVTCTHDAGLRSQLPQLRPLKPRYVVWGEGTSDEMCLGIVIWSAPA
jgi:hypothetical protein